MKFSVDYETRQVTAMTARLTRRMENPRPFVRMVERYIKAVTVQMFRRRPDRAPVRDVKWPALADSTWKQKAEKGLARRPLIASRRLLQSIKVLYRSKMGFVFGTKVRSRDGFPYPAIHNVGGWVPGRPPQRKWLFLRKKDMAQIRKMALDYLVGRRRSVRRYVTR
jgi:phage gpG-like protein